VLVERYFDWLTRPVRTGMRAALPKEAGENLNFYAKSLTEPFWVYMKLAIVGGLILAGPFVVWSSGGSWRRASTAGEAAHHAHHRLHGGLFRRGLRCSPTSSCASRPPISDQLLTNFQGDAHSISPP